jgi:Peptidase A4 family
MAAVLTAGVLCLGLSVPATVATASTAKAKCGNGDCIWAGWGTSVAQKYTGITGDFQVPTVRGKTNGTVAVWDGLGGTACSDPLEQTGVSASIVKGKPVYRAWWEVIYYKFDVHSYCWNKSEAADAPHFFKQTVKPGDWMDASVTYSSSPVATGGTYWLYLKDVDRGWSENVPVTAKGINGTTSRDSAESIVEDVGAGPLPNFGTADPGNIRVYPSSNLDYGWTQQKPVEYTLGTGKVNIAPISPAGDFTVSWKHS